MHFYRHLSVIAISASAASLLVFAASSEVEMQESTMTATDGSSLPPSPALMNQLQPPPRLMELAQERATNLATSAPLTADAPAVAVGPLTGPASVGAPHASHGLKRKNGSHKPHGSRHRRRRHKLAHIFRTALYLIPASASPELNDQASPAPTTPKGGVIIAGIIYTHTHALLYLHDGKDDLDTFDGKSKPSIKRSVLRLDIKGVDLPDGPDEDPSTGLMCFETDAVYGYVHGKNLASPKQKVKICGNLDQKLKNVFKMHNSLKKIKARAAKKKHALKQAQKPAPQ